MLNMFISITHFCIDKKYGFVVLVTMISLIVSMGAPVSWYCQMGKNHHVIRYHYMFWTGTCYLSCIRMYATGIRKYACKSRY